MMKPIGEGYQADGAGLDCRNHREMLPMGSFRAPDDRHRRHAQQRHRAAKHVQGLQQIAVMHRPLERTVKMLVVAGNLLRIADSAKLAHHNVFSIVTSASEARRAAVLRQCLSATRA